MFSPHLIDLLHARHTSDMALSELVETVINIWVKILILMLIMFYY